MLHSKFCFYTLKGCLWNFRLGSFLHSFATIRIDPSEAFRHKILFQTRSTKRVKPGVAWTVGAALEWGELANWRQGIHQLSQTSSTWRYLVAVWRHWPRAWNGFHAGTFGTEWFLFQSLKMTKAPKAPESVSSCASPPRTLGQGDHSVREDATASNMCHEAGRMN